jgi:hypothetical protein
VQKIHHNAGYILWKKDIFIYVEMNKLQVQAMVIQFEIIVVRIIFLRIDSKFQSDILH